MTSRLTVVVGGQYGSEGKGAIAAHLSKHADGPHWAVRVAGPNAGHTAYDDEGNKFAFRSLPVAAVTNPTAILVIAAGSEIDPPVLHEEIELAERHGHEVRSRLLIDSSATVITDAHKQTEADQSLTQKLGSTAKGIGAARADRLMRKAFTWGEVAGREGLSTQTELDTGSLLNGALRTHGDVLIEGTQGFGLGLHGIHYPQCTSSDCRAIDFCSMAGVAPWTADEMRVVIVARSYPIRVAGNSGPLEGETSWEELGLEPEQTTVTKKTRRVGAWDAGLVRAAVRANGGGGPRGRTEIAWTMADQRFPQVAGLDGFVELGDLPEEVSAEVNKIEHETGAMVTFIGTSPTTVVTL